MSGKGNPTLRAECAVLVVLYGIFYISSETVELFKTRLSTKFFRNCRTQCGYLVDKWHSSSETVELFFRNCS